MKIYWACATVGILALMTGILISLVGKPAEMGTVTTSGDVLKFIACVSAFAGMAWGWGYWTHKEKADK